MDLPFAVPGRSAAVRRPGSLVGGITLRRDFLTIRRVWYVARLDDYPVVCLRRRVCVVNARFCAKDRACSYRVVVLYPRTLAA